MHAKKSPWASLLFCGFFSLFYSVFASALSQITLDNGDILHGELVSENSESLTLYHTVLGEITVRRDRLVQTVLTSEATPVRTGIVSAGTASDTQATAETSPETKALSSAYIAWLLPDWQKQLTLGISGADGNSRSQDIHTTLAASRETTKKRWNLQLRYDSSEKNGDKTRDEFTGDLNKDWLLPNSPYFYFASGRVDWDNFQDWDYRMNVASGLGYDFFTSPERSLRGRAGLGVNREFGGVDDNISPEGVLELASAWALSEHHNIELKTTFYPQLEEFKEFRNITSLAWVNKLNSSMRLNIGLSNEHDTDVPNAVKRNDFKYTTTLSWDL